LSVYGVVAGRGRADIGFGWRSLAFASSSSARARRRGDDLTGDAVFRRDNDAHAVLGYRRSDVERFLP
jgi:hypothetical protein